MNKIIGITVWFIFSFTVVIAQQNTVASIIAEGIKLHDRGDYTGAIEKYNQALKIDKHSQQANYELASTYFAYKKYDESLTYCNKVIAANNGYVDQAYILKGSTLDITGKHTLALKTYKEGIKKYANNSLLYYNLALTAFNLKEYKDADDALMKALKLSPAHASSHLLLGYSMSMQGYRIKSILALSNFLMLEPTGKRAESALALFDDELKKNISVKDSTETTITVPVSKKTDAFSSADFMLTLLQSSNNNEANKGKTKYELLSENMKSLFSMLA
ncbi:MAG TPA: tetratricopeptide repeat protein, partial [Ferruginibacter sp.]|nr:tetratricopeptide repeat protein [Ferruginibacter sp.]